jgi:branched-chain amino acid transport system substrate-binding protein
VALLLALAVFFLFSPYDSRERNRRAREELTSLASTPMEVAVVWPTEAGNMFVDGVMVAAKEINARGGITIADENGNPVKVRIEPRAYDEYEYRDPEKVAARVVGDVNLSAVIGHSAPDSAIKASITYQDAGLLYLSPAVSDAQLSQHSFWGCVQTIPSDAEICQAIVTFALERGWRRAAVLYVRNAYGSSYDRLLREDMGSLHAQLLSDTNEVTSLSLSFHSHYGEEERSFYLMIAALLRHEFDFVFVADSLIGSGARRTLSLISQLREMGVKQPILGTEELHSGALWTYLDGRANGIFTPSLLDRRTDKTNPIDREFRLAFRKYHSTPPSMVAAQGYEAVILLSQAAERARSKVPIKMATMFVSTGKWDGLQGEGAYEFSLRGSIQKKRVFMEEMKDGIFVLPQVPQLCVVYTNGIGTTMTNRGE